MASQSLLSCNFRRPFGQRLIFSASLDMSGFSTCETKLTV